MIPSTPKLGVAAGLLLLVALRAGAASGAQSGPATRFDLLIRGGVPFDGTGAPGYRADIAVTAGRIARIGDLARETAANEIDASRLYVAPGFINIHSHPIADGLTTAVNMLTQGVTTEILNPDGGGPLDIAQQMAKLAESSVRELPRPW